MKVSLAGRTLKFPRWLLALALVGVVGTGLWLTVGQKPRRTRRGQAMTVPAKVQNLNIQIQASGTIIPTQAVNISPKTSGRLVELLVDQGDRVQQGQMIARMEDSSIQAQRVQAQGNLLQAQANLLKARNGSRPEEIAQAEGRVRSAQVQAQLAADRRQRNLQLYRQGAISRDQYEAAATDAQRAQADFQVAQEALAQASNGSRSEDIVAAEAAVVQAQGRLREVEVQLADTIIRAPFSGTVTQKYASVGAFVTPTTSASSTSSATSASIVALASELEVVANVPESSISQIRPGQAVIIRADAYPGKDFRGVVRLVAPEAVVSQNVTSFQVRVRLTSGQQELKSGMNVDLRFQGQRLNDALVVPTVAIVSEKGQTGVLVPGGERQPQFRPVTIGVSVGDQTQVIQGLNPGQPVFVYLPKPPGQNNQGGGGPPIRFR